MVFFLVTIRGTAIWPSSDDLWSQSSTLIWCLWDAERRMAIFRQIIRVSHQAFLGKTLHLEVPRSVGICHIAPCSHNRLRWEKDIPRFIFCMEAVEVFETGPII